MLASDPAVMYAGVDVGFAADAETLRAPDVAVDDVGDGPGWATGAPPRAVEGADQGEGPGAGDRAVRAERRPRGGPPRAAPAHGDKSREHVVSMSRARGHDEGRVEGQRAAVLAVLAARGLLVSEVFSARRAAETEATSLDRLVARAAIASSSDERYAT